MHESSQKLAYCINQYCDHRENIGENLYHCESCGGKLLVGDRYRLIKRLDKDLNEGYTAKWVYEGIDTEEDDKHVVLKIIDFTRPDLVQYLKREYEFLLNAPRPFYSVNKGDFFVWNPSVKNPHFRTHVLVVPKLEGVDSETWIQEHEPLDELECMVWLFELLPYLETFAEIPAIYRDLTPANLMVTSKETIQPIDFGSVKILDNAYLAILEGNLPNEEGTDIRRGTRIFTPAYAPREQLFGLALPQSDFFALGRTITYWMTGKSPVDLWEQGYIDLAKHRPDLSKPFIQFVEWLTQDEPGARPANVRTIRYFLEETYVYLIDAEDDKEGFLKVFAKFRRNFLLKSSVLGGVLIGTLGILAWVGAGNFFQAQGLQSLNKGDYPRAYRELSIAHSLKLSSLDTLKQKSFACLKMKDLVCADRLYRAALKIDSNDPEILYQLGITQEELFKYELAKEFYQRSIEADFNQIDSQLRLTRLALEDNSLDTAQKYLADILKRFEVMPEKLRASDRALYFYYQGWFELIQMNYQAAEFSLLKSSELLPNDEQLSIGQGDVQCLLAQAKENLNRSNAELNGARNGCLQLVPKTLEAGRAKDQIIQDLLNFN